MIFLKRWFAYNETLRGDVKGNSSTSASTLTQVLLRYLMPAVAWRPCRYPSLQAAGTFNYVTR